MLTDNMVQVNFKPTRHQVGCKSSLLDLYLTNIPDRLKNVSNFLNTLSEHEGVRVFVNVKSKVRQQKSFILCNYSNCTFNILQPMVDENIKLQTLFSDLNPVCIAEKLMTGLKEVTDLVIVKKRVQKRSRGVPFWSPELEEEQKRSRI